MAAEVSADLTLIQDEDVLRRMWAETEDFGRKKEIRARMYKLREQRLKDFYTTGEVVTEITGRKHATTTHTESIGDQGFLTMKSKEIRDSESPTRDFSRRGNGYWTSVEERGYTIGDQDGAQIERSEESRKGEGVVVEGKTETRMSLAAQNIHEKSSKSDENMSLKSEATKQRQAFSSQSVTEGGDSSSRMETSETQNSKSFKEEKTSESTSSTRVSSSSTSSRRIVTSSATSTQYQVSGEESKLLKENEVKAITSGDGISKFTSSLPTTEQTRTTNIHESNTCQTTSQNDESRDLTIEQPVPKKTVDTRDTTFIKSLRDSSQTQSEERQAYQAVQSSTRTSSSSKTEIEKLDTQTFGNQTTVVTDSNSNTVDKRFKSRDIRNEENVQELSTVKHDERTFDSRNDLKTQKVDVNEFITNEKIDSSSSRKDVPKSIERTDTDLGREHVHKETTIKSSTNEAVITDNKNIQSHTQLNTDQKILNEIHKLDTYLLNQNTPGQSEPATPKSVTDGPSWTVVSNRDGEFVYQTEKTTPKDSAAPMQTREPMIKHPSSIDLPKDATEGQYVTTYQQSYNRISVDNSPSHEFFVRTLRASPDRLTPSPTKTSRSSLDRNSPDRKLRTTSRGSLDRSSPESSKRRSFSKGSLDRSTPERSYRSSPSKTPDRERRGSSESYTIEKRKDSRRKTTEITQQTIKDSTNKTKRKFSSTQQKAANKTRVSTPGVSPSTSPTRSAPQKELTSGSESDISHNTYNKTSISSFRDENIISNTTTKQDRTDINIVQNRTSELISQKSKPRETSPEYSSEGSVSREINKNKKFESDVTVKSTFQPIKVPNTDHSSTTFINEEIKQSTKEETNETIDHSEKTNYATADRVTSSVVITDVTNQVTDETGRPVGRGTEESRKVSETKKYTTTKTKKSPSSSPERKIVSSKTPYGGQPTKASSPERKSKDRQPLRQINQRNIGSTSTTVEITSKFTAKVTQSPGHSPSASPERRQLNPQLQERRTQKKTVDENRRSVSSSPETRRPKASQPSKASISVSKVNESKSKRFKMEEKRSRSDIRERSVSSSPDRKPTKQIQKPVTPKRNYEKSPSKQRPKRISPSSSPDRMDSPDRKPKLSPSQKPKAERGITRTQQSPRIGSVVQRTAQKTTETKETFRTTRQTSIPRANSKLSPKNSRDKMETTTNNKSVMQVTRKATPIPKSQPPSRIATVTRTTSKITERKQQNAQPSPVRATNIARKSNESPRRSVKAPTPKFSPDSKRTESPNRTTIKKINSGSKLVTKQQILITEGKSRTLVKQITDTVDTKTDENVEFLNNERATIDLEDENPPDEFYAEYDYKTDDTGSPERQPKTSKHFSDIKVDTGKETKTIKSTTDSVSKITPQNFPAQKGFQNTKESTTTRKTTKKTEKKRRASKHSKSSSSSSSDEDEIEQNGVTEQHISEIKDTDDLDASASTQDLLTVVVQHPKSSRESSPGYPNNAQPFCTTSDDGESNPRYADFISEPEDVEVFDKTLGPSTPVRLTEDETADVKSVADRVNVFLEATRQTQETIHQSEVDITTPKSVLKTKAIFENIAKNQSSVPLAEEILECPTRNNVEHDITTTFIQEEIKSSQPLKNVHDDNDKSQTINKTTEKNKIGATVDVTSKKDHFERKKQEVETRDVRSVKKHVTKESFETELTEVTDEETLKQSSTKQKSQSPQRPNTSPIDESFSKKPLDRKSSGPVEAKKELFERKSQVVERTNVAQEKDTVRKSSVDKSVKVQQSFNIDVTTTSRRSSLKEKSPSPQRQVPKISKESDTKKKFERKPSTAAVDVSSKKDFFERKVQDLSTSSKTTTKRKEQTQHKPSSTSHMIKESQQEVKQKSTAKKQSPERDMINRRTESEPGQPLGKATKPEEIKRKPSRPDEIIRKPSKPTEITHRSSKDDILKSKTVDEKTQTRSTSYMRSTTSSSIRSQSPEKQPEEKSRKPSKPEEIIRRPSKPQEIGVPSKTDELKYYTDDISENRSNSRTDSYMRSTITSSIRSHTPEDQTNEFFRKISKEENTDVKTPRIHDLTRMPYTPDYTKKQPETTKSEITSESRTDSYMRSTVSSSNREQTPEKQFGRVTPESTRKTRPQSPVKYDEIRRKSSVAEEVLEETALRRTSIRTETKQDAGGKFGVTLRKTPSAGKMTSRPSIQRQNSKPGEVNIESIFDLELLEEMLLKAVGYEERRRIRAQIRLVKKQIEDEKNIPVSTRITKTTATTLQSTIPSVRDIKRQTSPSKSPERHEPVRSSPRASPERRIKAGSPEKRSPERSPTRRISSDKVMTNGYRETRTITETTSVYRR